MTLAPAELRTSRSTTACPVCDGEAVQPYVDLGTRRFDRCSACRTVFQSPLPTKGEAQEVHTDRYDGASTGYFAKADKKLRKARFEMALFRQLMRPGGRFLDIGCNAGFMVAAARDCGFDAHGIDIDPVSIAYARKTFAGATFYAGLIEQLPANVGQFDFVHCSEVIEHVPQAKDFIFAVASVLKPRGFLYLTTPNITHWSVPSDRARFKGFRDPGHCIFYSPASLRGALRQVGIDYRFSIPNAKPGMRMLFRKQA